MAPGLIHKHLTRLERPDSYKHSSLIRAFVNYGRIKFYNTELEEEVTDCYKHSILLQFGFNLLPTFFSGRLEVDVRNQRRRKSVVANVVSSSLLVDRSTVRQRGFLVRSGSSTPEETLPGNQLSRARCR